MEEQKKDETNAEVVGDLQEWQTPELIVEDVNEATRGGTTGDVNPIDDAWYS